MEKKSVNGHFKAIMALFRMGRKDLAEGYLVEVRDNEGSSVYEAVCAKISKETGTPPKNTFIGKGSK